jgi:hypothetical protein
MRSATFDLATAVPRGLAWLSLLAISAGVAYALTAAALVSLDIGFTGNPGESASRPKS